MLPESTWSQEVRLRGTWGKSGTWNLGAFNSRSKNRIVWQPGRDFWMPENVWKVWARGIEGTTSFRHSWGAFEYELRGTYSFTRSTYEEGARPESLGNQLIYVPLHNARFSLKISKGNGYMRWQHTWVGKQFTTRDQSAELPGYQLSRGVWGYSFESGQISWNTQFQIDNVWGETYQTVAWRPMPGRSFQLNLNVNWNP